MRRILCIAIPIWPWLARPAPMLNSLPYLTESIPAVRATFKQRYEDFRVEEIPAYEPCGHGDHTYFVVEKAGLATLRAVADIAKALGVPRKQIGVAGLKDARGITTQMLSIEHVEPSRIAALRIPRIRVLSVGRHTNKLRIGHLRGNRFILRLRDVDPSAVERIREVLAILLHRGVPNYFGAQRFGSRGDTGEIGRAMLRREPETVIALICGRPCEHDTGPVRRARELFEAGDYESAAKTWPYMYRDNRRVCLAMARTGGDVRKAMHAIDRSLLKFFVSAYQSHLFNQVVAKRIDRLDRVLTGDLAFKHANGAVFRVEDPAAEQPRADLFDISPTGPLFGYRMTQATGEPGAIESTVLHEAKVSIADFGNLGPLSAPGGRRPLRFQPVDPHVERGSDDAGPFIELRFTLAAGCYATMVLREICKSEMEEGRAD